MRKLITFLLVAGLAACSGGGGDPAPSSSSGSQCGCSKYNKADCGTHGCTWTTGKGCGC